MSLGSCCRSPSMAMTYSPSAVIESRSQRGSLPEVAAQFDDHYATVDRGNLLQHPEGIVAAAVIDKYQLERLTGSFHYDLQPVVELGDILFFVMERYDDGILGHRLSIITSNSGGLSSILWRFRASNIGINNTESAAWRRHSEKQPRSSSERVQLLQIVHEFQQTPRCLLRIRSRE